MDLAGRTARRGRRGATASRMLRWCLICALGVTLLVLRPPVPARAVTFDGHVDGAEGQWWGSRPDYTPMTAEEYYAEVFSAAALSALPGPHRVDGIKAGSVIRLEAKIVDRNGLPIHNAVVTFRIRGEGIERTVRTDTDTHGVATVMQRIPRGAKGVPLVVAAWADTTSWSSGDYSWFIPE